MKKFQLLASSTCVLILATSYACTSQNSVEHAPDQEQSRHLNAAAVDQSMEQIRNLSMALRLWTSVVENFPSAYAELIYNGLVAVEQLRSPRHTPREQLLIDDGQFVLDYELFQANWGAALDEYSSYIVTVWNRPANEMDEKHILAYEKPEPTWDRVMIVRWNSDVEQIGVAELEQYLGGLDLKLQFESRKQ